MEKRYLAMWMWLFAGKLKVKTAHFPVTVRVSKSLVLKLPNVPWRQSYPTAAYNHYSKLDFTEATYLLVKT